MSAKCPDLLSDKRQRFCTERFTQTARLVSNAYQQHRAECVPPPSLRSKTVSLLLGMNGGEYVCAFALIIFSLLAGHILLYDASRKNRWLTSNSSRLIFGIRVSMKAAVRFYISQKEKSNVFAYFYASALSSLKFSCFSRT